MSSKKQTAKQNFMNETMCKLKVLRTLIQSWGRGWEEEESLTIGGKVVDSARRGLSGRSLSPYLVDMQWVCPDLASLVASHAILDKITGAS